MTSSPAASSVLMVSRIELSTVIMLISSVNNKVVTGIFSSM
jgi:hypothetical protein